MKNRPNGKLETEALTMEALIKEKMMERKFFGLDRTVPTEEAKDLHTSLFEDHVATSLQRQLGEMPPEVEGLVAASQPLSTLRDFGGLQTKVQLRYHLLEKLYVALNQPMKLLDFTVQTGSRVIGTPYDLEWGTGCGIAFGSRFDGKLSLFGCSGSDTVAVGFYLSSPERLSAAITPMGSYDFSWAAFQDIPSLRSRGGLGITVYVNENPQPILSRQALLWSTSGATLLSGETGTGRIEDASSPSGLGPVRLAPIYLDTGPDLRYLVWVYCWQVNQIPTDSSFISIITMNMPFVNVNAGPLNVIH